MTPKISLSMIVRDETRTLARAIASARPHVDQIVVVDTGSTDGTWESLTSGALKTEVDITDRFTACNENPTPEGRIDDFSMARNRALQFCTHDVHLWLDADDILVDGHRLPEAAQLAQMLGRTALLFPYAYAPTVQQRRERMHHPRLAYDWMYPVHETLQARRADMQPAHVPSDLVRVVHDPHPDRLKEKERDRNWRILTKQLSRAGYLRPREMFYMVQECRNSGRLPEAARWGEILGAMPTGPSEDERAICWMWLVDIYNARLDHERALTAALRAHATQERWPWPLFKVADVLYHRAFRSEDTPNNFRRAVDFYERGLRLPIPDTAHFVNPLAHAQARRHLATTYAQLHRHRDALRICDDALQLLPDDPHFLRQRAASLDALREVPAALHAYDKAICHTQDPVTQQTLETARARCLAATAQSSETA